MITNKDQFIQMREDEIMQAELKQHEKDLYLNNHNNKKNGKIKSKECKVQK